MPYVGRLALLKGFFPSLPEKYLYEVICPSDGTYNNVTYFEEKIGNMRSEPQYSLLRFGVSTPKLPRSKSTYRL